MGCGLKLPALVVVACGLLGTGQLAVAGDVERGLAFVQANCAQCHAIGGTDASPLAEAPALSTLREFYEVEDLEESLAEGIVTGHPAMPVFQLGSASVEIRGR